MKTFIYKSVLASFIFGPVCRAVNIQDKQEEFIPAIIILGFTGLFRKKHGSQNGSHIFLTWLIYIFHNFYILVKQGFVKKSCYATVFLLVSLQSSNPVLHLHCAAKSWIYIEKGNSISMQSHNTWIEYRFLDR